MKLDFPRLSVRYTENGRPGPGGRFFCSVERVKPGWAKLRHLTRGLRGACERVADMMKGRNGTGLRVARSLAMVAATLTVTMPLALLSPQAAHAEDWPAKPVKIIAAFAPGGSADIYARLLAGALSVTFRQQFYVENRPGSSGALGSAQAARSEPDGYTLLIARPSHHRGTAARPACRS